MPDDQNYNRVFNFQHWKYATGECALHLKAELFLWKDTRQGSLHIDIQWHSDREV